MKTFLEYYKTLKEEKILSPKDKKDDKSFTLNKDYKAKDNCIVKEKENTKDLRKKPENTQDNSLQTLKETLTPHEEKILKDNFTILNSQEKMSPTKEFLEVTYNMMRRDFFGENTLPSNLNFVVKSRPRSTYMGTAGYKINSYTNTIIPLQIFLNSSRTLTLHDWMGVVLHEMIHIYDYTNNPEHFLGFFNRNYDAHGKWFMDFGSQFKKYGFSVEKYCSAEIGMNVDDKNVQRNFKNMVLVELKGFNSPKGAIIKISKNDIEKYKTIFQESVQHGRFKGLEKLIFYTSENPNVAKLRRASMRNSHSGLNYWFFNDKFKNDYGPLKEIETYDITPINEDRDEQDYDLGTHLKDDYAKKIYDNITNVVNVEKLKDNEYKVEIF